MANKFELQKLPYEYNALEPFISKETLRVHHNKHFQTYCDKFNLALENANIESSNISEILSNVSDKPAIRNMGGGYWNHNFYFESLSNNNNNNNEPSEKLLNSINKSFGSFDKFKEEFSNKAVTLFGSGWTWLSVKDDGSLIIYNTQNQDNYMMDICKNKEKPILVIDVWEHAYYIDYQNRRPEYIEKFFNVINWCKVSKRYEDIVK